MQKNGSVKRKIGASIHWKRLVERALHLISQFILDLLKSAQFLFKNIFMDLKTYNFNDNCVWKRHVISEYYQCFRAFYPKANTLSNSIQFPLPCNTREVQLVFITMCEKGRSGVKIEMNVIL